MNCEQIECPICFDVIDGDKNKVTTECGHQFHARCLMQNVAHNGFDCPCCRTEMAKKPHDDEDDDDETFVSSDEDSYVETDDESSENTEYDDYVDDDMLRGFRLFTNLVEGETPRQEDVVAEYQYNNSEQVYDKPAIPTIDYITSKIVEQHGITMHDLVITIMTDHPEYENDVEIDRISRDIWGKMRMIVSNFMENQERAPVVEVVSPVVEGETPRQEDVVAEYQYKNSEQVYDKPVIPIIDYITRKLVENGITMHDLVRTIMVDHPEYENDEVIEDVSEYIWTIIRKIVSNFMENQERAPVVEGETTHQEDVVAEYQYNNSEEVYDKPAIPTVDYVTRKLVEHGITMRVLVESIMANHPEYENDEDFDDVSRYIWGKMRIIVSNFKENQERAPVVEVVSPVVAADVFDYKYIENIASADFSSVLTYGEDEDEDEYMRNLMNEVVDFVLEDNNIICV